ncbi:hypothetical protein Hdeb2414_s0013g00412211 [Helianthus debilis subsp. tardiflorus]
MTETSTPTRFERETRRKGDRSTDGGVGSPIGATAEVGRSSGSRVNGGGDEDSDGRYC